MSTGIAELSSVRDVARGTVYSLYLLEVLTCLPSLAEAEARPKPEPRTCAGKKGGATGYLEFVGSKYVSK